MKFPYLREATKNLFSRPSTVQYPNKVTNVDAKPDYRGRIAYDPEKCTVCGMCEKVCCPGAITVTREEADGGEYITRTFDLTSCTFCGTCADFCEEGSIQMTADYHMVATDPRDLLVTGTKFKEASNELLYCSDACIYCTLCARNCPQNAITVDRAAKTWQVDHDKCVQCGICVGKCPKKALSFRTPEEIEALEAEKADKAGTAPSTASAPAGDNNNSPAEAREAAEPEAAVVEQSAPESDAPVKDGPHPAPYSGSLKCSDACIYCTLCARNCPMGAITVDRAAKTWEVDSDKCIQCGLCVEKCPKKALSLE